MTRALACALALLAAACDDGGDGWSLDLERMIDQPRSDPYAANGFFADGRAMRPPPEGAVPRGAVVGPPLLVLGYAPRAAPHPEAAGAGAAHPAHHTVPVASGGLGEREYAREVPLPVTRALLASGQRAWTITCAACHGVLGDGRSVVARHMALRPPPSLHEPPVRGMPPGRVYAAVNEGYGLMPSYAPYLTLEERWAVVAYVQALKLSQSVALPDLPPSVREEAERELR